MRVSNKIVLVAFGWLMIVGCQKLQPKKINTPEYPDLKGFSIAQAGILGNASMEKTVMLDGQSEIMVLSMDSLKWRKELSFFNEMNPNQPEYVGAFLVNRNEERAAFDLKSNENGILKQLTLENAASEYTRMTAVIHEDKDIYVHHRDINVSISNGQIDSFTITGYQKVILKDTVWFSISGKVL